MSSRLLPTKTRTKQSKLRPVSLIAVYVPAVEGGYVSWILGSVGIHKQGDTFEEARENLFQVIELMLEDSAHQIDQVKEELPPGAITERIFVLLPL